MAIAPQRMPVPPIAVMPSEGIAPVVDPASTGTAPDASPTTMVLSYLKSRGFQPTSENVRRALEANQRDPGVIPGLVSDRPATEAEDQAAMAAARGSGGARGGRGLPVPPIPPNPERPGNDTPSNQNTSAAPATDASMQWGPGAAALATAILGGGAYAGSKLFQQARTPVPGQSVPPPPDVAPRPPGAPGEIDYTMLNPERSPMDVAMERAVPSPVEGVQPVGPPGAMNRAPPQGPVEPIPPQRITPQTLADLPPPTPPPAPVVPPAVLDPRMSKPLTAAEEAALAATGGPMPLHPPRRAPTQAELDALRASRTSPNLRGVAQPTAEDLVRGVGRVVRK